MRLPARIPSRGVRSVAGKVRMSSRPGWFASGAPGSPIGNATNPRTGSGMQQARDLRAEETVEVVRNHEDGTGFRRWLSGTEAHGDVGGSGCSVAVTPIVSAVRGRWRGEGARFGPAAKAAVFGARAHESHERRSGVRPGQQGDLCRGAKARGSARFHPPRGGWGRRGAVGTPRRPARRRARSGRGR